MLRKAVSQLPVPVSSINMLKFDIKNDKVTELWYVGHGHKMIPYRLNLC